MVPRARIDNAGWQDRTRARGRALARWPRASAGRVATWAASLGAVQAALLLALAPPTTRAVAVPTLACAFAGLAAMVVAIVWFVRMLAPRLGGWLPIACVAAVYGGLALIIPDGRPIVAIAVLPAALLWARWLPAGAFAVARAPRAIMRSR
jgi:hypothetical protein